MQSMQLRVDPCCFALASTHSSSWHRLLVSNEVRNGVHLVTTCRRVAGGPHFQLSVCPILWLLKQTAPITTSSNHSKAKRSALPQRWKLLAKNGKKRNNNTIPDRRTNRSASAQQTQRIITRCLSSLILFTNSNASARF